MQARLRGITVPSILVADDNANIQKMVALAFEARGIKVVAVGNGEAAVRRIPELNPDLVLADIFMPVRSGYEVCEFVKNDARFAHIPVILLVGAFDPLDEKEARRVGADGVLKKPFVPPDPLIAMVTSALEKNPHVAAENAKPKTVPASPLPMPELEVSAKPAPRPVPEFPEPSAEEAELAYGFGTRESILEGDQETGSSTASEEPAAKAAQDAGEDFDGASTSSAWRRSAMSFEVPAEAANQVAFSSDGDFEESIFPSAGDAHPASVRAPRPVQEVAPPVEEHATVSAKATRETSLPAFFEEPASGPAAISAPEHTVGTEVVEQTQSSYSAAASIFPEQELEAAAAEEPATSPATLDWVLEADADANSRADVAAPEASGPSTQAAAEESFFADESAGEPPLTPAFPAPGTSRNVVSELSASAASPAVPQLESEPGDAEPPLALRDPGLVEPAAVRVIPEALLVEEEPQAPSNYGARLEEIPPVYSFVAPAEADAIPAEPLAEKIPALEFSSSASHTAGMSSPSPFSGRGDNDAANSETVDAVVRKVLEKLEPQLHELLSQGLLKPLVENLLQNELAKKQK